MDQFHPMVLSVFNHGHLRDTGRLGGAAVNRAGLGFCERHQAELFIFHRIVLDRFVEEALALDYRTATLRIIRGQLAFDSDAFRWLTFVKF